MLTGCHCTKISGTLDTYLNLSAVEPDHHLLKEFKGILRSIFPKINVYTQTEVNPLHQQ